MIRDASTLVICEHCDAVYHRRTLHRGERAFCLRCGAVLYRHQVLGVESVLALSVAGLLTMLIANVWPIVTIGTGGITGSTTLWGAIVAAWNARLIIVAGIVAIALFVAPLFQLGLLTWACAFVRAGRTPPGVVQVVRGLRWLRPWSMIEVLILGILVAMSKLGSVFDITPGIGLWAFAALMVLVTLIASWDTHVLWDAVPERRT